MGDKCNSRGASREAPIIQGRGVMPTEVAASWVEGKMGSESACILKVEPTRLADKLDVGCERKKE